MRAPGAAHSTPSGCPGPKLSVWSLCCPLGFPLVTTLAGSVLGCPALWLSCTHACDEGSFSAGDALIHLAHGARPGLRAPCGFIFTGVFNTE